VPILLFVVEAPFERDLERRREAAHAGRAAHLPVEDANAAHELFMRVSSRETALVAIATRVPRTARTASRAAASMRRLVQLILAVPNSRHSSADPHLRTSLVRTL